MHLCKIYPIQTVTYAYRNPNLSCLVLSFLFFSSTILVRNLLNLVPKEEWDNLEQHDQLENKVSVFAELLMETEKWEASSFCIFCLILFKISSHDSVSKSHGILDILKGRSEIITIEESPKCKLT